MNDKVKRLVHVYGTLTDEEKQEFRGIMKGVEEKKGVIAEDMMKDASLIMGPLGGKCPYCGK